MSIGISIYLSIFKLKARGRRHAAGGDEEADREDLDTAIEIVEDLCSLPGAGGKTLAEWTPPLGPPTLGRPSASSAFLARRSGKLRC